MAPDPKRRKDPSDPHIKFLKTSRDLIRFARNHMNSIGAISADIHRLSQNILQESNPSGESPTNTNQSELCVNIPQAINDNEINNGVPDRSHAGNDNETQDRSQVVNVNEIKDRLQRVDENENRDRSQNIHNGNPEYETESSFREFQQQKTRYSASYGSAVRKRGHHTNDQVNQSKQAVMYPRIINMEIKHSNELSIKSIKPFDDLKLPDVISPRHSHKSSNGNSVNTVLFQYNGPYNRGVGTVLPDSKPKENKSKPKTKKPISAFKFPEPTIVDNIVQPIVLHRSSAFNGKDLLRKKSGGSRYTQRIDLPDLDPRQSGIVIKIPTGNERVNVQLPKIQVTKSPEVRTSYRLQKLQNIFKKPLNTTWPRVELDEQDVDIETYQLSPSIKSRSKRVISRSTSSPMEGIEQDRSPIVSPGKRVLKRKDTVILPKINPAPPPTRENNSPCFHRHYLTPSPRQDSFPGITIRTQPGHLAKGVSFLYPQLFP